MFMKKAHIRENFTRLPRVSEELESEINVWDKDSNKNVYITDKCIECMNKKYSSSQGHNLFFTGDKCLSDTDLKNYSYSSLVAKTKDDCFLPKKQLIPDYSYLLLNYQTKNISSSPIAEDSASDAILVDERTIPILNEIPVENYELDYSRYMNTAKSVIWKDEKVKLYIGVL